MMRDYHFTESMVDKMRFGEVVDLLITTEESIKKRQEKKNEKPKEPVQRLSAIKDLR